jgi:cyclic pyranopterin phosphate synthase
VRAAIETRFRLQPLDPDQADPHGAAVVYGVEGTGATCGFISSMTEPFCRSCNRIRLRGDGEIRPCLASSASLSIMEFVRPRWRPDDLEAFLRGAIPRLKLKQRGDYELDSMSAYGG